MHRARYHYWNKINKRELDNQHTEACLRCKVLN